MRRLRRKTMRRKRGGMRETRKRERSPMSTSNYLISAPSRKSIAFAPDTSLAYLKQVCDDANFCTAFGRETDLITQFFQFPTFQYVVATEQLQKGANGFVTELVYDRQNYRASAILKTDLEPGADNLYLEAYNGMKYINRFAKQFPCFLETYGAFTYRTDRSDIIACAGTKRGLLENSLTNPAQQLARCLAPIQTQTLDAPTLGKSCLYNSNMALLIQYINDPVSFHTWIHRNADNDAAFCVELPCILFQIYAVLSTLSQAGVFTHFDMHGGNVLLYKIPDDQYVTMKYINGLGGRTVAFKTRYIAKIIDYGRAFLPENAEIYALLCTAQECNATTTGVDDKGRATVHKGTCGDDSGYNFFEKGDDIVGQKGFYISTNRLNNAHDLRLATGILTIKNLSQAHEGAWLRHILMSVSKNYATYYGSPHYDDSGDRPGDFVVQRIGGDAGQGVPPSGGHDMLGDRRDAGQGEPLREYFPPVRTVNEMYWSLANMIAHSRYLARAQNTIFAELNSYGTMTIDLAFNGIDAISPMQLDFVASE
jgi:hypothetical protein